MKSIIVHPTYFPSIVQMAAMVQSKEVVFEMDDNYQKQSYRNRTYIAHSNGILLLNIPVKHRKDGKKNKTKSAIIENSFPWQLQHWKSLESAYRTSPYFEFYEDELKPIFFKTTHSLFHLNLEVLDLIFELLDLKIKYTFTTEYFKNPHQQDLRYLVNPKLKIDFKLDSYFQVLTKQYEFLPNLSILDLLFNEGPNTIIYLENQKINFKKFNPKQ
tara:strand:+ start:101814 stop:102458 length:645 start_codon:yes stop_codon:yes gene_type:complete